MPTAATPRTRKTATKTTTTKTAAKKAEAAEKPKTVKKPAAPRKPKTPAQQDMAAAILQTILTVLDDNKAEEIVHVELAGKSALADHMVIASGRSSRHVTALSEHIDQKLCELYKIHVKVEGKENGDWVLVDTGDVIVHLFRPEVRAFYNIEKLWGVSAPAAPADTKAAYFAE